MDMDMAEVAFLPLEDGGDERGSSFALPHRWLELLRGLEDLHVATIRPGHIRGNHFHVDRRELLVVVHVDRWSFHWDRGDGTEPSHRSFEGAGAMLIAPPPNWSHAVRNDGAKDLWLVGASDVSYDPDNPDAFRRVVTDDDRFQRHLPDVLPHQ